MRSPGTAALFAVLGAVIWAGALSGGAALAGERLVGEAIPGKGKAASRQLPPRPDSRMLADRIDRREPASANKGVMRFGDTEVRIGGRASVGYGYSSR